MKMREMNIHLKMACEALEISRATAYRYLYPKNKTKPSRPRARHARRIPDPERVEVLDLLHSPRLIEQPPRQVYAELLDQGVYLVSVRTMYRILADQGETRERRNQRRPRHNAVPRLVASQPNEVWIWDIFKLPTCTPGVFLNLYLLLD